MGLLHRLSELLTWSCCWLWVTPHGRQQQSVVQRNQRQPWPGGELEQAAKTGKETNVNSNYHLLLGYLPLLAHSAVADKIGGSANFVNP